jgi:hypothetical protein
MRRRDNLILRLIESREPHDVFTATLLCPPATLSQLAKDHTQHYCTLLRWKTGSGNRCNPVPLQLFRKKLADDKNKTHLFLATRLKSALQWCNG